MSIAWAILFVIILVAVCCGISSVLSGESMTNRDKSVILYTRPDCVYCNKFMPVWEDLKRALIPHGYQFVEYNGILVPNAEVKSYPTIFLIDNAGHKLRFDGIRTYENLKTWILANRH